MLENGLDKCDISRRTTRVGDHPTSRTRPRIGCNSAWRIIVEEMGMMTEVLYSKRMQFGVVDYR